jgi:hypothetical protein
VYKDLGSIPSTEKTEREREREKEREREMFPMFPMSDRLPTRPLFLKELSTSQ